MPSDGQGADDDVLGFYAQTGGNFRIPIPLNGPASFDHLDAVRRQDQDAGKASGG